MGSIFSLRIGIPSSTTITVGGIIVFLEGYVNWAIGLWLVAMIWLISVLLYRRPRVQIDISKCEIIASKQGYIIVRVQGFINSRHSDGLINAYLGLYSHSITAQGEMLETGGGLPLETIESSPRKFEVPFDILNEGRNLQEKGQAIDIAVMYVSTQTGDWESPSFRIPMPDKRYYEGGWVTRMRKKLTSGTKRKSGGMGINRKQFHKILAKASQPIKKSDSEKS